MVPLRYALGKVGLLISLAVVWLIATPPTPAAAYNGQAAANYANTWWNGNNSNYPTFPGNDCTNFVSQALHSGGGFPYVGKPGPYDFPTLVDHNTHHWWVGWWDDGSQWFDWSSSWSTAHDYYSFLMAYWPGGIPEGMAHTLEEQSARYTPDSVVTGDLIFFDFQGDGIKDHINIQVGIGTDPNSLYYGNYSDQHTTARYHAFWSLLPYNAMWPTTTVFFVHISSSN